MHRFRRTGRGFILELKTVSPSAPDHKKIQFSPSVSFVKITITIGLDVLESVQPEAMDPYDLKRRYGARITFFEVMGKNAPAFTVASFTISITSRL
jgi:hypothetical protein